MSVCFGKGPVFEGNYGKGTIVVDSRERIASLGNMKRSFWQKETWNPHLFGESFLRRSWGWMQATPKFLGKKSRPWRAALYFTLLSLVPSFVWSQVEQETLGRVLSPPPPLAGNDVPGAAGPRAPPRLSMVLKAGTHQHRDPGPAPGPGTRDPGPGSTRAAFGGALLSWGDLRKATPCLGRCWEVRKREAICKTTTVTFKF